jgi:N-hydroxyarylamine O-acetyltransferase
MSDNVNLHAYFDRIEWGAAARPDLDTLTGLLRAHMDHIPFENLDALLGRAIRLDLASLQDKMVKRRRGGYCFEHATLFAAVLAQLGFAPQRKLARVVLFGPRETVARTHMFLLVPLGDELFVVDPGFGALAPPYPLPLHEGMQASLQGGRLHWMARDGIYQTMHTHVKGEVVSAWTSTLEEEGDMDFEMGNHHVSTHPASPFVNRLMLRALTPEGRVTVLNRDVTIWRGEEAESCLLEDRADLRALLVRHFGFDLPEVSGLKVPGIPEWH